MALLRRDCIVDDTWRQVDDESELPFGIPVIVTYGRWQKEREALLRRNGELGIVLASDQSPGLIAAFAAPMFGPPSALASMRPCRSASSCPPTVDRTPTATQLRLDKGDIASDPLHGSGAAGSWSY